MTSFPDRPSSQPWHRMGRRSHYHDYQRKGIYHITIHVSEGLGQPLGRMAGSTAMADGTAGGPHVELTAIGLMVEEELTHTLPSFYPMLHVEEHVVMPEHLHFLLRASSDIVSRNGRPVTLGRIIAGFKQGCNRRFWLLTGQGEQAIPAQDGAGRAKPASALREAGRAEEAGANSSAPCGFAAGGKVRYSTHRLPLFSEGFVDVMPVNAAQLQTQRTYIRNNPRNRLLRMEHRNSLTTKRAALTTALSVNALMRYLREERAFPPSPEEEELQRTAIATRLLTDGQGMVTLNCYGDQSLLTGRRLLPVVCHRRDQHRQAEQRDRCLQAARTGAVLVSARIAKGEQGIMDAAMEEGLPVVLLMDNGMPDRYHPSEERTNRCATGLLLMATPWHYHYRGAEEGISVTECKTLNCVAQAICRLRDDWWK